jgi:hypothetical protein
MTGKMKYLFMLIAWLSLIGHHRDIVCQSINLNSVIGEIEHKVDIVNGQAVVTIPLPKLKGVRDLTPNLDIVYKSGQHLSNSELGLGWSLSGLSQISRCVKTFAQDGLFDTIKFNQSDKFCLDGQRLVLASPSGVAYGSNGSEYRTELESYQKIVAYYLPSYTLSSSPDYFKVYTKSNLILTFGQTYDSTLSPYGIPVTHRWLLNKIEDYTGGTNSIQYSYLKEYNYCYLSSIAYANRLISFNYASNRTDVQTKYYAGRVDTSISKLLTSVVLYVNNPVSSSLTEIKRFKFDYNQFGSSKLSLLQQVNLCFPDSTCIPPMTFEYGGQSTSSSSFGTTIYHSNICGTSQMGASSQTLNTNIICEHKQMADMDGDGRQDVVAFGNDGLFVSLNKGSYFEKATKWTSEFGRLTGWDPSRNSRQIVDVNNDGLPDVVCISFCIYRIFNFIEVFL